jgi:actin related protein 2/3 complex subunit 5
MTSSTAAFTSLNFRTINIDALDADSSSNFDLASLTPGVQPVSASELQSRVGRVRGILRGGDAEGALREALMSAVYGDVPGGKVCIYFLLFWRGGMG